MLAHVSDSTQPAFPHKTTSAVHNYQSRSNQTNIFIHSPEELKARSLKHYELSIHGSIPFHFQ